MDSMEANHKANELCNRYGMDVISCGSTIAFATEAFQSGLIDESHTGGIRLDWNQPDVLLQLIRMTAYREGFGDELAEGVRGMSEKFGGKEFAIHVKGLECPMHDPRALWGMALTYATSIRGACHCADSNLYTDLGLVSHGDLGVGRSWPFRARGKAAQTVASQRKGIISNSAVICIYAWVSAGGALPEMLMMLNSVTGFGYTRDELCQVADRIWYLKRAIGNLCGATREDDQVPRRILEPHLEGATSSLHLALYPQFMSIAPMGKLRFERLKTAVSGMMSRAVYPNLNRTLAFLNKLPPFSLRGRRLVDRDPLEVRRRTVAFEEMIEEFYRLRGIDERGRPSRERLESLGLKEVADILHG